MKITEGFLTHSHSGKAYTATRSIYCMTVLPRPLLYTAVNYLNEEQEAQLPQRNSASAAHMEGD